jgi:hypothetical protein
MAGEIGYVIGRDRASGTRTAARIEGSPGEFIVMQALVRSLQDRLDAAVKALAQGQPADAPATPATPAVVQIPLESFDPLGGAPVVAYSGTLSLASCTGFGDAPGCAAQNDVAFTLTRVADGTLTLSSALFEGVPAARSGGVLHAQGPIANPAYALACPSGSMATFFDAALTPTELTVTNGLPAISRFSATLTITAPADSTCTQTLQAVYTGTIARG